MGAFTAFLDLALGIASPALDWSPTVRAALSVFVSTLVVLGGAVVAMRLLRAPRA